MWVSLSFLAILVVKATAYNSISSEDSEVIQDKFREYMIVPQMMPKAPHYLLTLNFGRCKANLGNIIAVCETAQEPLITWPYPNEDILYTIVAFTTSTPGTTLATNNSNLTISYFVSNVRGANVERGDKIIPITLPNPLIGIGYRRTIYLACRQARHIDITAELYTRFARTYYRNFNVTEFLDDFNLTLIAGNFFLSKRTLCDDTCCSIGGNSCGDTCGSQGCSSSLSARYNSYDIRYN